MTWGSTTTCRTSSHNIWVNPGEDLDNDRVVMDPDDDDDIDNDGNGKVDDFIGWDCVNEDSYPSGMNTEPGWHMSFAP